MTSATLGYGALLQRGDGQAPEVFTTVGEVRDISGPGFSLDTVEATHQASPDGWKEYIAGLIEPGELSFDINYLPADATQDAGTGLLSRMAARAVDNYKLVFPDAANTEWTFPALVTSFEPTAPVQDRLAASLTLKVTGKPTLA